MLSKMSVYDEIMNLVFELETAKYRATTESYLVGKLKAFCEVLGEHLEMVSCEEDIKRIEKFVSLD